MATGLFVGLITLDFIYRTPALPNSNQKIVALDYAIAAGGPATNAAVTFRYLANTARLMGVIGCHPISRFILSELQAQQIIPLDLRPEHPAPPPTSSILVTAATGERAVISINATRCQASVDQLPPNVFQIDRASWANHASQTEQTLQTDIVLIDGHQMAVGAQIAKQAQNLGTPVVVDGGSWKPDFEMVLAYANYVICSANFHPPGCQTIQDTLNYLRSLGVANIAITRGEQPIVFATATDTGELPVPAIQAIDTLGAGDVFHGAFCHFILQADFPTALRQAAEIAAQACQSFGTRAWMNNDNDRQEN